MQSAAALCRFKPKFSLTPAVGCSLSICRLHPFFSRSYPENAGAQAACRGEEVAPLVLVTSALQVVDLGHLVITRVTVCTVE